MDEKFTKYAKIIIPLVLLSAFAGIAYYKFITYRPALIETSKDNQKSEKPTALAELPIPTNYKELSSNSSNEGGQITLQTSESLQNSYNFYKNVLIGKGWTLRTENKTSNNYTAKLERENSELFLSATIDGIPNETVISIEYKNE